MPSRIVATCVALCGIALCSSACSRGDAVTIPPLVSDPAPELPGKFVWHNLITTEPEVAKTFYGNLFGWEFETLAGGGYIEVTHDGHEIGGIVDATGWDNPPRSSVWLSAVSVPNVGEAVGLAKQQGAKQIVNIMTVPDVGQIGVIEDPGGAVLQFIHAQGGDPPDATPAVHTWLWHELITDKPAMAAGFYKGVLGYEIILRESSDGSAHRVLKRDGAPRAGVIENPFEDTRATWIPFVRVNEPAALLPIVERLGGKVVIAPRPDLRGGTLALILDPSGAPIALQQWSPSSEAGS